MLALGLILLVGAWIAATTPFGAPDEGSHYVRALGISNGTILGPKVPYPGPQLTPTQEAFINHDTRAVNVPRRLSPGDMTCIGGRLPTFNGSCREAVANGNFPPLGYLLPALALRASHDASTGLWLTRAASALQSLAFLMLAVAVLWNGAGCSLIGLLVAVSPLVLFVSSVMNPSGIEITASLACGAAALRIARAPARAPHWVWITFALAGAVAILAGPIGLVFTIADAALFAVMLGYPGLRELSAAHRPLLRSCTLILLAAAVLAMIYSRLAGFSVTFGVSPVRRSLRQGLDQLWSVLHQAVGNFASLSVPLPSVADWIWWLLVLVLLTGGLWLGNRHDRVVLGAVLVLAFAFVTLFWAWVDRYSGFGLQAREVLPPLLLIPLAAGEVICRRGSAITQRRSAQLVLAGVIALIAVFQAYAWWFSARAAAGAPHAIRFYSHATWSPPLGWYPWIAAAGLGTAALLAFAATEAVGYRATPPGSSGEGQLDDPQDFANIASTAIAS